eukprot:22819-Eustigmatos_ZCMA.PRE.1
MSFDSQFASEPLELATSNNENKQLRWRSKATGQSHYLLPFLRLFLRSLPLPSLSRDRSFERSLLRLAPSRLTLRPWCLRVSFFVSLGCGAVTFACGCPNACTCDWAYACACGCAYAGAC